MPRGDERVVRRRFYGVSAARDDRGCKTSVYTMMITMMINKLSANTYLAVLAVAEYTFVVWIAVDAVHIELEVWSLSFPVGKRPYRVVYLYVQQQKVQPVNYTEKYNSIVYT